LPEINTYRRQYDFAQRSIAAEFVAWEHPGTEPAPSGAALQYKVTLPSGYTSAESFQTYLVGPWALHNFTATKLPAPDLGNTAINTTLLYDATRFPTAIGGVALA